LWFTEWSANKIGRITTSGVITEFDLPPNGGGPYDIVEGPDGNLWYTRTDVSEPCGSSDSGNAIGRMTPTGSVVEYPLPNADGRPFGITVGRDGNLWFAECSGNRIGRVTPIGAFTEQDLPFAGTGPYGIASGPKKSIWFTEYLGNRIGRIQVPLPAAG
jgi:streptogramin lyase